MTQVLYIRNQGMISRTWRDGRQYDTFHKHPVGQGTFRLPRCCWC
jgi:hypothetical protein